jgi:hypothetical protein
MYLEGENRLYNKNHINTSNILLVQCRNLGVSWALPSSGSIPPRCYIYWLLRHS